MNDATRNENQASKSADANRRKCVEDLNDLGLLSFRDRTNLTPLDTLFDRTAASSKADSKVRPII